MKSAAGQGSTFTFALAGGQAMANELILIVEDNAKNRKLVRDVLEHRGLPDRRSRDGRGGRASGPGARPDLVLMDIQLPGMNGIAALRRASARTPATRRIPVMAVTASAMRTIARRIMAAGFRRLP